jgi:hypothetical protein
MSPQPYFDNEPDIDVPIDHGPANECAMCGATDEPLTWHELCRMRSADPRKAWDYGPGWRCVDRRGCEERRNGAW